MGGNGGNPVAGSDGGNGSSQIQGTEYTLQGACDFGRLLAVNSTGLRPIAYLSWGLTLISGVMRFLQTEWHRHERDRNAWQIERAEMKSRIGKLEGDLRTNKRLRESMDKHIRMLEQAMRKKNQEQPPAAKSPEEKSKSVQEGKNSAKPSPSLKRESG